ncbi:MAG: hypothetical protein ACKOHI_12975 [Phycisphaerales bacterium]
MSADLDAIQAEAMAALAAAGSPEALAGWKGAWIGGNGRLKSLMTGVQAASAAGSRPEATCGRMACRVMAPARSARPVPVETCMFMVA